MPKPCHPLDGVRLKINRAKTHFDELNRLLAAFFERNPYRIICDKESEPGILLYRINIVEAIPKDASAIIGDVIHNLRAALDLLATELAVANGRSGKDAYFPFDKDPAKCKTQWLRKRMGKPSNPALRFVRRLKPYPGGNKTLWDIHALDLLDKHQAIVPVGAANSSVNPDFAGNLPSGLGEMFEKMREGLRKMPIFFRPADRQYPLKDGAILLTTNAPKPGDPDPNPQFRIEIAFGEGQVVDGEPVVGSLQKFVKLVERITEIAERRWGNRVAGRSAALVTVRRTSSRLKRDHPAWQQREGGRP